MSDASGFLYAGSMDVGAEWQAKPHSHPFTEILLVASGEIDVRIGERCLSASAGDVVCYPHGTVHRERVVGGKPARIVFFGFSKPIPAAIPLHVPDRSGRVAMTLEWLLEEHRSLHSQRDRLSAALAMAILEELVRLSEYREQHVLADIRAAMQKSLRESHTVEALSAMAGMSRYHFIREYGKFAGRPPMADLKRMRIAAAAHLLLTSDLPLKSIAEETGFCDEYYFSRAFKQELKLSPGVYRKKRRMRVNESALPK